MHVQRWELAEPITIVPAIRLSVLISFSLQSIVEVCTYTLIFILNDNSIDTVQKRLICTFLKKYD